MYELTGTTRPPSRRTPSPPSLTPADDHDLVHHRNIVLASISEVDLATFRAVVAAARVNNETSHWDCQDYVLEILETLEGECLVGFDGDGGEEEEWGREREGGIGGRRGRRCGVMGRRFEELG